MIIHCLFPREHCRINPSRFLAECHVRRLNQGIFCLAVFCDDDDDSESYVRPLLQLETVTSVLVIRPDKQFLDHDIVSFIALFLSCIWFVRFPVLSCLSVSVK